jgi:hypothetical protein
VESRVSGATLSLQGRTTSGSGSTPSVDIFASSGLAATDVAVRLGAADAGALRWNLFQSGNLVAGNAGSSHQLLSTVYSAAGIPIPACAASYKFAQALVSDATSATPGTAYTSSGGYSVPVRCVFNATGSVYAWQID